MPVHIQRNSVTGALLYIDAGGGVLHLAKECCCEVGSPPCDCTPALDFAYTVTLSGFAAASDTRYDCIDGDWDVEWTDECRWFGRHSASGCGPRETTRYWTLLLIASPVGSSNPTSWQVRFQSTNSSWYPIACAISWDLPIASTDPCTDTPVGSYSWLSGSGCAGNAEQSGIISCSVA